MRIRFEFQVEKAIAAMAYLVGQLGRVDKAKLMKMVYIADREHFLRCGAPITGDRQVAMKHGPLPSICLNVVNGDYWLFEDPYKWLHLNDHEVSLKQPPVEYPLSPQERETLNGVLQAHGHKNTWQLVKETHQFPEYKEFYVENTSTTIPYEAMLKAAGDEQHFRNGRPVISQETVAAMLCPFDKSDADL